jgi:hypothetical protein
MAITPNELSDLQTNTMPTMEASLGADLGGVRVHYNSSRPAQLQAHAYAQGTDIHVAPGARADGPAHEAWHVTQQGAAAPVGGFGRPR